MMKQLAGALVFILVVWFAAVVAIALTQPPADDQNDMPGRP